MALIKCSECGKEISDKAKKCPHCGFKKKKEIKINLDFLKKLDKKKIILLAGLIVIILILLSFLIISNNKKKEEERYNNLPIKVDISMTSYYGSIDYILYELGLDFDLVTMGANCYTGVQKSEFNTEKYGILHTEFRYCKSNKTQTFRVYNDESDQELRDPNPGELASFDYYGDKITGSSSNGNL